MPHPRGWTNSPNTLRNPAEEAQVSHPLGLSSRLLVASLHSVSRHRTDHKVLSSQSVVGFLLYLKVSHCAFTHFILNCSSVMIIALWRLRHWFWVWRIFSFNFIFQKRKKKQLYVCPGVPVRKAHFKTIQRFLFRANLNWRSTCMCVDYSMDTKCDDPGEKRAKRQHLWQRRLPTWTS